MVKRIIDVDIWTKMKATFSCFLAILQLPDNGCWLSEKTFSVSLFPDIICNFQKLFVIVAHVFMPQLHWTFLPQFILGLTVIDRSLPLQESYTSYTSHTLLHSSEFLIW